MASGRVSSARKRRKRRRTIFVLELIILCILGIALFIFVKLGKIGGTKLESVIVNDSVRENELLNGYLNVAIFGVDSREGELTANTRSDMIMIASINNSSGEVRIVSVYRDSYLDSGDGDFRKATEAYALGGPQQAVNMLNKNLDLNIKDYVTFDFRAVTEIVDLLDGIDIEITYEEMELINQYSIETSRVTGKSYEPLTTSGVVHLNGVQATSYGRIRYTEGDDYKRTERQRLVIEKIVEKVKAADLLTLNSIIDKVFPNIATSFTSADLISMAAKMFSYDLGKNTGFPFDKGTMIMGTKGDCVIPVTLESNVIKLHEFLFDAESYTPSSTVVSLSEQIANESGMR